MRFSCETEISLYLTCDSLYITISALTVVFQLNLVDGSLLVFLLRFLFSHLNLN